MSGSKLASNDCKPGALILAFRKQHGLTLEDLADLIERRTDERPSSAKLSRIENGKQPVPTELVEPLSRIIRCPAADLRPDLAAIFEGRRP